MITEGNTAIKIRVGLPCFTLQTTWETSAPPTNCSHMLNTRNTTQDTARQTLSVRLPTHHSVAWAYVLLWILCMQVKYSRLFTIYGWIIKSAWHAVTFIRLHMIWLHVYTLTICSKIRKAFQSKRPSIPNLYIK